MSVAQGETGGKFPRRIRHTRWGATVENRSRSERTPRSKGRRSDPPDTAFLDLDLALPVQDRDSDRPRPSTPVESPSYAVGPSPWSLFLASE